MTLIKPIAAMLLASAVAVTVTTIETPQAEAKTTVKAKSNTIKTVTVTSTTIKNKTTYQNKKIDTVIIKGVTSLPKNMFKGSDIKTLSFDSKLKTIGTSAFEGAKVSKLKNSMKQFQTIDSRAFYNFNGSAAGTNATFEPLRVGNDAFYKAKIRGLILTDRIERIGERAFQYATIYSVSHTQSKRWANIKALPFKSAYMEKLTINAKGSEFGAEKMYQYAKAHDARMTATKNLVIKERAFYKFKSQVFTLNGSVKKIEKEAFASSVLGFALQQVNWNVRIDEIGDYAFRDSEIAWFDIEQPVKRVGYGAFYNTHMFSINMIMDNGSIADAAFKNTDLKKVYLSGTIDVIENGAFTHDDPKKQAAINYFEVDGYVRHFGSEIAKPSVKRNVPVISSANSINIKGVGYIGENALALNKKVKNVEPDIEINGDIEHIGKHAFTGVYTNQSIHLNGNIGIVKSYAFDGLKGTVYLPVRKKINTVEAYVLKNTPFKQSDKIGIIKSADVIQDYAFAEAGLTGDITLNNPNATIGKYAFYNNKITKVWFTHDVALPAYAFAKNPITDFSFEENVRVTIEPTTFDPSAQMVFDEYYTVPE